jgi:hypothetical protein
LSSNPSVFTTPVSPNFESVFGSNSPSTIPSLPFPENKTHINYTGLNINQQGRTFNQNSNMIVKNNQNSSLYESPINSLISTPNSTTQNFNSNNQNETFEQKWARIQAAKKTNPFAEDIAKKFEIKL